ncbi:hypothetical protein [Roseateles noduli]|uniref:hypothetical protein n=1 Tax=Roseateles noduli TaxID=2052484 RepID=UPI003D65603B
MYLPISTHPALSSAPTDVSDGIPSGNPSRGVAPWRTRDDQQTVQTSLALAGTWHPAPDQRAALGRLGALINDWRFDTAEIDYSPEHRTYPTFTLTNDDVATVLTVLDAAPECLLTLDGIQSTREWRERLARGPQPMSADELADLCHVGAMSLAACRRSLEPDAKRAALRREASLAGWRDAAPDAPTAARRDLVLALLSRSLSNGPGLTATFNELREPDDGPGLELPPLELLKGFEGQPCKLTLTHGRVVAPEQFAARATALKVQQLRLPLRDGRLPDWATGVRTLREMELSADGSASKPTWRALFHQFGKLPKLGLVTLAKSMGAPSDVPSGWVYDRSERRLWAKDEILASPYLRAANSSIVRRGP